MFPCASLYTTLAHAMAADTMGLGIATFLKVVPIIAPYVPSITLLYTDLTYGTDDIAPIAATQVPIAGVDPITGQAKILVPDPVGGWKWTYSGDPAGPISVYGYALCRVVGSILLAVTVPLNPPIELPTDGQDYLLVLGEASFLMVAPPLE